MQLSNMSSFKLSATLEGHEQDVKAIVAPFNDTIVSASRDSTVRVWTQNNGVWSSSVNFTSNGFVNSIKFDPINNLIVSGGQDKMINLTDLSNPSVDAKYVLIGHENNVCCLDYSNGEIISGSWDSTANVWADNKLKYSLIGHNASVWDVKILGDDCYLTSSADKTVKLWKKNKAIKTFTGHSDVVRGLLILPGGQGFASTSNDGTVRISDFEGNLIQTLIGHESFVYAVKILSNGDIVTSGEDRTVRIWRDGKAIQVITLPSISIWTVAVLPNDDIVTGGSDSVIRVFTRDSTRVASEAELEDFKKSVEGSSINAQSIDDTKTVGPEALDLPGTKEGQVIMVKTLTGTVEAHQWNGGIWVKIGEVVGSATSDKKQVYDGQKWDFVFDVDVQDGVPPLKLPYNVNENPYTAATRFLEANELPASYTEEVVRFIAQNTQGVNIGSTTDVYNPYADTRKKVIPHNDYLGFTTSNPAAILKGVAKFNETEKTFNDDDIESIKRAFNSNDIEYLLKVSSKIIEAWSNKLPGFDILRTIIFNLKEKPSNFNEIMEMGLTSTSPQVYFMAMRLLSNVFLNKSWGETTITDSSVFHKIVSSIKIDTNVETKHLPNISNALATLLLNYSVYASKYKAIAMATNLKAKIDEQSESLTNFSSEAAYRLSVAYGNLTYIKPALKDEKFGAFKNYVMKNHHETRFSDVFKDIDSL